MGLSSLQGRLLMLVARQSDIELQEMDISESQNQLASMQKKVAEEYNEALSNTKLVINVESDDADSFESTTKDLDYKTMSEEGLLPITARNEILLQKDEDGNWIIPTTKDGEKLISIKNGKAIIEGDAENKEYKIKDGTKYLTNSESIANAFKNVTFYLLDKKK